MNTEVKVVTDKDPVLDIDIQIIIESLEAVGKARSIRDNRVLSALRELQALRVSSARNAALRAELSRYFTDEEIHLTTDSGVQLTKQSDLYYLLVDCEKS